MRPCLVSLVILKHELLYTVPFHLTTDFIFEYQLCKMRQWILSKTLNRLLNNPACHIVSKHFSASILHKYILESVAFNSVTNKITIIMRANSNYILMRACYVVK